MILKVRNVKWVKFVKIEKNGRVKVVEMYFGDD